MWCHGRVTRSRRCGFQRQGSEAVLTAVLDRVALYGVLTEIEALGLDLLEVRQLTPEAGWPERGDM